MHERISIDSLCFMGASLPDLSRYWRELGAHRVSLVSTPLLQPGGEAAAQAALASGDYALETIPHPFMFGRHLEPREESWSEPRSTLSGLIRTAHKLGARSIYVVTGGHGTLTWEEAARVFSAAIAPCVQQAREAGIALALEDAPPLYADTHIAHTLRDTLTVAEMAGIGVCMDLFACWTEAGLHETIKRAMPRCPIIQVCDYVYGDRFVPSRAVPGDGAIPVKRILDWALNAGYAGAFDLELLGPRIEKEGHLAATRRAADNVGKMLQSLGV